VRRNKCKVPSNLDEAWWMQRKSGTETSTPRRRQYRTVVVDEVVPAFGSSEKWCMLRREREDPGQDEWMLCYVAGKVMLRTTRARTKWIQWFGGE